jgi:hypothetical protein
VGEVDLDAPAGPGGAASAAAPGRPRQRWHQGLGAAALVAAVAAGVSAHAASSSHPAAGQDASQRPPLRTQYEVPTPQQVAAVDADARRRVAEDPRLDEAASRHWACTSAAAVPNAPPYAAAACDALWEGAQQRLYVVARAAAEAAAAQATWPLASTSGG